MSPPHVWTGRTATIALALAVSITVAGCASASQVESPTQSEPPIESAPTVKAMTPDAKRSVIATSFPIEVPVPEGEFVRSQAQGDDAWDYEVRVRSTPEAMVDWYRQAYSAASWTLTQEGDFTGASPRLGGRFLTFRKGSAAQSEVTVEGVADAEGMVTVRVILGVGAPVLETQ
jgi:uncharacterized protein YceK